MKYAIGEDMVEFKIKLFKLLNTFVFRQIVLTKKKNPFEKFDNEVKIPPILSIQVWDNDSFGPDDFLGTLSFNLSHFQRPFPTDEKCKFNKTGRAYDNIFAINGSTRGWFPVLGKPGENGDSKQTVSNDM